MLQAIALVELARPGWVESVEVERRCWPVLIHQLLAMSLASDGVTAEDAWAHLSRCRTSRASTAPSSTGCSTGCSATARCASRPAGSCSGPKAERRFGRKNFMELFAVFSSPQTYTVQTSGGQPLGSLNQAFVDRLVDGVSSFLLGGRGWAVVRVQHDDRRVVVEPAPRGRQPTWGGFLPQFLGRESASASCARCLRTSRSPTSTTAAAAVLAAHRDAMRASSAIPARGIEVADGEIRWWTFAGGRINATLRYALEAVGRDWKVIPDNFLIKVRGDRLDAASLREALARLREVEFWENEKLWARSPPRCPTTA